MGFAAAAPYIAQGAGLLFGGLMGRRAQQNALKRTPEEQAALGSLRSTAGTLSGTGGQLLTRGQQTLSPALNYFQTLLQGNRAAMSQAVAGPTAQITDYYRGAQRYLNQAGVRGAARDQAQADLGRERASQLASLVTGVQPGAASALASAGSGLIGQGGTLTANAGNIYGNLLSNATANKQYAEGLGTQAGAAWGKAIGNLGQLPGKAAAGDDGGGLYDPSAGTSVGRVALPGLGPQTGPNMGWTTPSTPMDGTLPTRFWQW
jgi:hypothetical protein